MTSIADLPDVNVWLALTNPDHAFHDRAARYWNEGMHSGGIAFCRITMLGFLRLMTNAKAMADKPFGHQEAWEIYGTYRGLPEVRFLHEGPDIETRFRDLDFPQRMWTDAYLAAFALTAGCRIVSFDRDFSRFNDLELLLLES